MEFPGPPGSMSPRPVSSGQLVTMLLASADSIGTFCCNQKKSEDRYCCTTDLRLQAIFDGHRGHHIADFASKSFYPSLISNCSLSRTPPHTSTPATTTTVLPSIERAQQILRRTFLQCHRDAKQLKKLAGTTAVVFWSCHVQTTSTTTPVPYGFCANAGDSRALLSVSGQSHRLTVDHKASCSNELQRIQTAGGHVELGRVCDDDGDGVLVVSRGFGNYDLEPSFIADPHLSQPIALNDPNNQFVVLASDGLWDVYEDQEVIDFILSMLSTGHPPQNIACRLTEAALNRGSKDDTTVVINVFNQQVLRESCRVRSSGSGTTGTTTGTTGSANENRAMASKWASPEKITLNLMSDGQGILHQHQQQPPPPRRLSRPSKKARRGGSIRMRYVGEDNETSTKEEGEERKSEIDLDLDLL